MNFYNIEISLQFKIQVKYNETFNGGEGQNKRKLPLFGFLFGNESSDMQRSELFFFVTPKILNQKEPGLNG